MFTQRVLGALDWDALSPVAGWTARDVVRHLTEWLPPFLSAGASVQLPSCPSVNEDPVSAWRAHSDAVQALLDDPATQNRVLANDEMVWPEQFSPREAGITFIAAED